MRGSVASSPTAPGRAGLNDALPDDLLAAGGLVVRPVSELPDKLRPLALERATADGDYDIQRH
jgi:hypothetical protein